jgi:hypothetical protein
MPIGAQSLQSYIATIYTSMVASTYKANIDSDLSIVSNPAGTNYVYPNNPVGLSVLVDPAFNLPQLGVTAPILLNGAASPVTVTLVAPGSNSYYACIYWDLSTSTAGVVYGTSGASPTPMLPDNLWRVPLAFVLLTTGQVTVVASNISDARIGLLGGGMGGSLNSSLGTISTNTAVNCNGANVVHVVLSFTAAVTVTLNNLRYGAPVQITATNTSAGALNFKLLANTPSGVAITVDGKAAGVQVGVTNLGTTGLGFTAATTFFLIGNSNASTNALFLAFC